MERVYDTASLMRSHPGYEAPASLKRARPRRSHQQATASSTTRPIGEAIHQLATAEGAGNTDVTMSRRSRAKPRGVVPIDMGGGDRRVRCWQWVASDTRARTPAAANRLGRRRRRRVRRHHRRYVAAGPPSSYSRARATARDDPIDVIRRGTEVRKNSMNQEVVDGGRILTHLAGRVGFVRCCRCAPPRSRSLSR